LAGALQLMDELGGDDPKRRARVLYSLSDDHVSPIAKGVEYCKAALQLFEAQGNSQKMVRSLILASRLICPFLHREAI
jgi:hypothetical protein